MNLDILAFAAHPDDAEIGMGATIALLEKEGKKVGIIDFTRGEMGTRGTAETRKEEADKAAKILGVTHRENLGLPDSYLEARRDYVLKIVEAIRKFRPTIIFSPYFNDRHPDHIAAAEMIKQAMFFTGMTKIETFDNGVQQERYRPAKLFYYMQAYDFEPSFIVDVSETFNIKMEALKAYGTQFFSKKNEGPETFISKLNFINYIEGRAKVYGYKIGKDYGEAFFSEEDVEINLKNYIEDLQ